MKMKLIVAALASAFAFGSAYAASTTGISDTEYKAQKKSLEANYKSAKERCKGMTANALNSSTPRIAMISWSSRYRCRVRCTRRAIA